MSFQDPDQDLEQPPGHTHRKTHHNSLMKKLTIADGYPRGAQDLSKYFLNRAPQTTNIYF